MKKHLFTLLTIAIVTSAIAEDTPEKKPWLEKTPQAVKEFQDMRFGMFIHWGPVSLKGTEIGWSRGKQVPVAEYDQLYKKFNPEKFNADEWAKIAKGAGMKYMVLTAKHHDGFCLWHSEYTDYDIENTPFKRDICEELAKACKKHGIVFSTYYSVCDWYHPDYPGGQRPGGGKKESPEMPKYYEYMKNQTKELIENYGPLGLMWFDGEWEKPWTREYGNGLYDYLKKIQPTLVVNNRVSKGRHGMGGTTKQPHLNAGDYDTPEQTIGGFNRDRPWETCMTICRQWAWKPNDRMKSKKQSIQTLLYTVGGDGNLLFNVGPTAEGIIEARQVERLKEMGEWIGKYKKGIYATRGGPFKPGKWGAATCKGNRIYLFVMKWNDNKLELPPIGVEVKKAKALSGGKVEMTQDDNGITLTLAKEDQKEIATVIELKIDGNALDISPVKITARPSGSLAYGKPVKASNVYQNNKSYSADKALDDDSETRWATDSGTKEVSMDIDLGKETEIGRVSISEEYDRVTKFELQRKDGEEWKTIFAGTKIGKNFKKDFPAVKAKEVRLQIMDATDGPTIWEVQLFAPKK